MTGAVEVIPFVLEQLCGETIVIGGLNDKKAGRFTKGKHPVNGQ